MGAKLVLDFLVIELKERAVGGIFIRDTVNPDHLIPSRESVSLERVSILFTRLFLS